MGEQGEQGELKGRIHCGVTHSNHGDYWSFTVVDEASGVGICEVRLTMEQFAQMLGNRLIPNASVVVPDAASRQYWGHNQEHTTVEIELGDAKGEQRIELVREKAKAFEVDGWRAGSHDLSQLNHHKVKYTKTGDVYRLGLSRYVPPDPRRA